MEPTVAAQISAVWREEAARIIASVARLTRDVSLAEEMAQDALVAALEHWPRDGVPGNAGAWLTTTAKRRAIDRLRQRALHAERLEQFGAQADAIGAHQVPDIADAIADAQDVDIEDDLLRLVFIACHPVLSREAQLALTLRIIGGLSVTEIARAFVLPEPTISQRIVRAKRTLSKAKVPFETPLPSERGPRLATVLEVIYLIFNEGHTATGGDMWARPPLCAEALRLGRTLANLIPADSEVHGLVALLEIQSSRLAARVDSNGDPVLLLDQDRSAWDRSAIERGLAALKRCEAITVGALGPYALQASIAACHARAARAEETDWRRIITHYDALASLTPSPIIDLNRAVAIGMADGPAKALGIVDRLDAGGALARYHLLSSVRGDLLEKLGRNDEARAAFEKAAEITLNLRERAYLLTRAARNRLDTW